MGTKVHDMGQGLLAFHCPGCKYAHPFRIAGDPALPRWTWNGSLESPTFAPSLLCNKDYPAMRCHLFLREGRIEFLSDCHHALAGQTVDCPDWDEAA